VQSSTIFRVVLLLSSVSIACTRSESSPSPPPPPPPPVPVASTATPTPTPSAELPPADPLPVASASPAKAKVVAAAPTTPFVAGEAWSGSYFCGGKPNTVTLKITKSIGNSVSAIFDFKTSNGKAGSFAMNGVYTPDAKHLALNAGNWIVQPPGVVSVNLDGVTSPDAHGFAGKVIGPGCSSFMIRR